MDQMFSVWSTLDARRRIIVVGATVAVFLAVLGLSRMASQPSMSLLYAGLDPSSAGEVVEALDQQGVAYDVRAGAIFVEAAQRDALRMTLAAEGLPATNGQGYEILERLPGFGTTAQMFDAAYWRAKEGELARTITSNPSVRAARVHIANTSSNPFDRGAKPTASVTLTTSSGNVSAGQANALKHLVASAVAGLSQQDVSIIDSRGGLVLAGDEGGFVGSGEDRAAEFKRSIESILVPRVGPGKVAVEVSVETETDSEQIFERRFDPNSRVAISSDTEELTTSSSGTQGGGVTVASNLPDGDAAGNGNSSNSQNSEVRERVNYEVGETTREIVKAPGAIKRITVAVLVDGIRTVDPATGETTWTARPDQELETMRELVSSAIGFDEARGDTITLRSLEFEATQTELESTSPSLMQTLNIDAMSLIQLAVLALVALALGLFVIRPILSRPGEASQVPALPPATSGAMSNDEDADAPFMADMGMGMGTALTGEIDDGPGPMPGAAIVSEDAMLANFGDGGMMADADPVDRLRQLIEERKDETVEVLRSWMEDKEETA